MGIMTSGIPQNPQNADQASLDRAVLRGFVFTAGVKWTSQVVSWSVTLIVARLLTPSDYGLVGMATLFLGLISLFGEFGIGTTVVTMRHLDKQKIAQLHTVSVLLGLLAFATSGLFAHALGLFFRETRLPSVIVLTSFAFLLLGCRTVPYSLLQKEMRYELLAFLEGFKVLAQALTTVVLAFLGFKFWALVIGGLAGTAAPVMLLFVWRPQRFAFPRWQSLRSVFRFSWHVCVSQFSWYAYDNTDFLIVGRVLGDVALGAYSVAWTIAHLPMEKFTNLVNRLTPPLFAAVQTDIVALRRYLRIMTETVSLVTFPASFGLALVAPEFVRVVLGTKWEGAILPLQLLGVYSSLRSVRVLLSPLLTAIGETRFLMLNTLLSLAVLPLSFLIGSQWGIGGVASCWVIVYPFLCVPIYRAAFRKIGMTGRQYFQAVWPAISGCLAMAAALGLAKALIPHQGSPYFKLGLEVCAGAVTYFLSLVAMHRGRLSAFYGMIQLLRHPSGGKYSKSENSTETQYVVQAGAPSIGKGGLFAEIEQGCSSKE